MAKLEKKINSFKVVVKKKVNIDFEDFSENIENDMDDEIFNNTFQDGFSEMD